MRFKPNLAKIQGTKNNSVYSNQLLTRIITLLEIRSWLLQKHLLHAAYDNWLLIHKNHIYYHD